MASVQLVDYSWSRPDPACLKRSWVSGVIRYTWNKAGPGQAGYPGKLLTRAEADRLTEAGLSIVSNMEKWAGFMLRGYAAGVQAARESIAATVDAGGPESAVQYYSVDFDPTPEQLAGPVADFLRGAASVHGLERTGVYGGWRTIDFCHRKRLAAWYWQTYAWSRYKGTIRWHKAAHIRQYRNNVDRCGGTVDLNQAMTDDYGQWDIERDDMPTADEVADAVWSKMMENPITDDDAGAHVFLRYTRKELSDLHDEVTELRAVVDRLSVGGVDTEALAGRVADLLAERLRE